MFDMREYRTPDGVTARYKISVFEIAVVNFLMALVVVTSGKGAAFGFCDFAVLANLMLMLGMRIVKHFYWRWPKKPGTLKEGRALLLKICAGWLVAAAAFRLQM